MNLHRGKRMIYMKIERLVIHSIIQMYYTVTEDVIILIYISRR